MTVGSDMHKALTMAESLKAQIETFGHSTEDKTAKADFYRMALNLEKDLIPALRNRTNYIEKQEPEFDVKQQAFQQAQQQQGQQQKGH